MLVVPWTSTFMMHELDSEKLIIKYKNIFINVVLWLFSCLFAKPHCAILKQKFINKGFLLLISRMKPRILWDSLLLYLFFWVSTVSTGCAGNSVCLQFPLSCRNMQKEQASSIQRTLMFFCASSCTQRRRTFKAWSIMDKWAFNKHPLRNVESLKY